MNTTFSSYNFQEDNIWDFPTEKAAKSFLIKRINQAGFEYREEYTLRSSRRRLDLIVRIKDRYIPIEVKKSLITAKLFAAAVVQAHSYAKEIEQPVFIGPILAQSHQQIVNLKFANVLAARLNVGIVWCGNENFSLYLGEKPILTYLNWARQPMQPIINLDHLMFREASGSKRKAKRV